MVKFPVGMSYEVRLRRRCIEEKSLGSVLNVRGRMGKLIFQALSVSDWGVQGTLGRGGGGVRSGALVALSAY